MPPLTDEQLRRYSRNIMLDDVGVDGQIKLMKAKVLIIGAGGLGSPLMLYLAAAGVTNITIIDDDTVELSNLQRQIIYEKWDIGESKAEKAAQAAEDINPDVKVKFIKAKIDKGNVDELISSHDIIADGCDNFPTRLLVGDSCYKHKKTLVSASVAKFSGQISTFKPFEKDMPCYRCLVGDKPHDSENSCTRGGVIGAVAGVTGSIQAMEVIREILGISNTLVGKLLIYDAKANDFRKLKLTRNPTCQTCSA